MNPRPDVKPTGEAAFETVIEAHLLAHGCVAVPGAGFDRERAVFPDVALAFVRETQPKEWARLEALLDARTGAQVLADLCKWMDAHGALATLRHGFKCHGRTLRIAFFRPAHGLNPELDARYAANRVGVTRQLRFSPRSEQSLDVVLSVNGVPVVTVELKNPLTGQTAADARRQYRRGRDPREPIFSFKRRTLVHFAADTESVAMTTRLAGDATRFLPFDRGRGGGAGNPPDPAGRGYRTAYLWEEVLARDSLLDLLARFLHLQTVEKRDDRGRRAPVETLIFPRYHQLQAVRLLAETARREGVGRNALVEHSAGSGKSNTIAWLAHRLASLHDAGDRRVFDTVVVVTDRVVLDQQLQDAIYQFEHKRGVVRKIDGGSRQLAEALEQAVPVVVTTLQKFPFVSRQLLRLAEERGAEGTGVLPTRRYAVVVDEAHSSQGGEAATELKALLGGEALRAEARRRAAEEGRGGLEELFVAMAKRGRQANLSFFAFTATPKHRTLKVFGRGGRPAHRYTMRQAIEEGFILDVLKHYTSYAACYRLLKACADDPHVERKKAARALARFLRLHPHNVAQKTEVMVEHFQAVTRHRIGGRAKAMVVTGSRLEAVRYKQSFDRYVRGKGYAIRSLVAFSGAVRRQSAADHRAMNAALDPAAARFAARLDDDEEAAEVWRGKTQAFRNLYAFLSQVIPYQDSDLERLYVYLRHLSAKLPAGGWAPPTASTTRCGWSITACRRSARGRSRSPRAMCRPWTGRPRWAAAPPAPRKCRSRGSSTSSTNASAPTSPRPTSSSSIRSSRPRSPTASCAAPPRSTPRPGSGWCSGS